MVKGPSTVFLGRTCWPASVFRASLKNLITAGRLRRTLQQGFRGFRQRAPAYRFSAALCPLMAFSLIVPDPPKCENVYELPARVLVLPKEDH